MDRSAVHTAQNSTSIQFNIKVGEKFQKLLRVHRPSKTPNRLSENAYPYEGIPLSLGENRC